MSKFLSPQALSWVRESAATGCVTSRVLVNLMERAEALEAAQQQPHQDKLDRLIALDRDDDAPTTVATPVATDNRLVRCYAQAVEDALKAGHGIDGAAAAGRRAIHDLGRQYGATNYPAAQPTPPVMQRLMEAPMDARGYVDLREPPAAPPVAPAGGLVKMVAAAMHPNYPNLYRGEACAAIREVTAWLDQRGQHGCSLLLREEADR